MGCAHTRKGKINDNLFLLICFLKTHANKIVTKIGGQMHYFDNTQHGGGRCAVYYHRYHVQGSVSGTL